MSCELNAAVDITLRGLDQSPGTDGSITALCQDDGFAEVVKFVCPGNQVDGHIRCEVVNAVVEQRAFIVGRPAANVDAARGSWTWIRADNKARESCTGYHEDDRGPDDRRREALEYFCRDLRKRSIADGYRTAGRSLFDSRPVFIGTDSVQSQAFSTVQARRIQ